MQSALVGRIWKAAEYVLPTSNLIYTACNAILLPALSIALPRMGICRYAPRTAIYNPLDAFRLSIPSLHLLQIIMKIQLLINHWNCNTPISKLLQFLFKAWAMVLGTMQPHLLTKEQCKALAEPNWWQGLYVSLREYEQHLMFVSGLEREETKIIPFLASWIPIEDLCIINWVCLYLGITMLQDLFEHDAILKQSVLTPSRHHHSWQNGNWPVTKPLSSQEFFL